MEISWEYMAKKKPQFSDDEYIHFGLTRIIGNFKNGKVTGELSGGYYTDRSRHSYGEIFLEKARPPIKTKTRLSIF